MGIAETAFDANKKGSSVALSGSNLTATVSSGTGSVLSTNAISGLTYFEMVMGATLSGSCTVGVGRADMSTSALVGAGTTAIGYNKDGTVKINNVTQATIAAYVAGNNIGMAIDPANKLIWFRVNGGNWNNDVIGNQNPVGAVGGISFATSATPCYAAWGGSATTSATAKFASGSWTYTAPTGYAQMDTLGSSTVNGDVADRAASFTQYGAAKGFTPPSSTQKCAIPGSQASVVNGAWYGNQTRQWSPAASATNISGQVQQSGVPTAGKTVFAFDSVTGFLLGSATSDGSGNYTIPALGRTNVFAVCLNPSYQAIVYDQLTPV